MKPIRRRSLVQALIGPAMLSQMGRAADPPAALRRIDEMTSREVESYLKEGGDLALIPFGPVSGHGVFIGQDQLEGRAILVRFVITRPSDSEAHFEQSYSADGGATWETNWIAVDTRH